MSWPIVRLGDVASTSSGSTPSRGTPEYFEGNVPWAKIQDLTRAGMWLRTTDEHVSSAAVSDCRLPVFDVKTVLLAMYGSIGTVSIAAVPTTANQAILGIRPSDVLQPEYLWLFLRHYALDLARLGRGGTQANINAAIVRDLHLPLPPVEDQRRLTAELTGQLHSIELLSHAALSQRAATDSLRRASYEASLAGPASRLWPRLAIGSLLESRLRTGVSGRPSAASDIRGLSLAAVRRGTLDLAQSGPVDVDPSTDRFVRAGRFYVVRGNGQLDLVGRAGLAARSSNDVVFPDLLIEMHLDHKIVHADYLQLVWDSRGVRADIESRARTASGIHKINLRNLAQVVIPLPPMESQRRIASELGARLDVVDQATAAIDEEIGAIEALPAVLLRRAFDGLAA